MTKQADFDVLRGCFCRSSECIIEMKFNSSEERHRGFDALMALMNAEINRIDTPIDTPIDIAPDFVNVEAVHDYGCEVEP